MTEAPRVVIIGAGFAGLTAAKALRRSPVQVTVVDRTNHHLFQPLLYQVATAGLSSPDIASPIRRILRRQANLTVLLAEATGVDRTRRRVRLAGGNELPYDYLIVATGAAHSYFGNDDWERVAPGLKTLDDALEIRRRVLLAFEEAEAESHPAARAAWLTFAVIGGGPTGAEMAGALAELARHTLRRDFRNFDPRDTRVVLVEAAPRVLPVYPEGLSARALRQLEDLGVEVSLGRAVTAIDELGLTLGDERLPCRTVVWAAGVSASPLGRTLGAGGDRVGRVPVESSLALADDERVFVAGDLATLEQDGRPVPGVAPAAIQQGRHAALNIRRAIDEKPPVAFRYRDSGSLATIGRRSAVADFGRVRLSGLPAWLAWLGIHIFFLIGFRNRFVVLFEWAWSYFTFQRSARLILSPTGPAEKPGAEGPQDPVPQRFRLDE